MRVVAGILMERLPILPLLLINLLLSCDTMAGRKELTTSSRDIMTLTARLVELDRSMIRYLVT